MAALPPLTLHAWLRYDVVRRLLPTGARTALEIGAGQGSVGAELARRYDYLGLEPDPLSYERAAQRVGAAGRVLNIALEELSGAETFDLVCAFEVLEHIEDDRAALAAWIERIVPGGWLLVSVPAGPDRFGASDVKVGHFRRYDREGLRELLESAGLEDVDVRTYGFPIGYALEVVRNAVVKRTAGTRLARGADGRQRPAVPTLGADRRAHGRRRRAVPARPASVRRHRPRHRARGPRPPPGLAARRLGDGDRAAQEVDDLAGRSAGGEDGGDAAAAQLLGVLCRDRAAHDHEHVLRAVLAQSVEDSRHQRHVRTREDRDPDGVRILLDRGLDDLLRGLVQTGVDHLHARIA